MFACLCVPGLPSSGEARLIECAAAFSPVFERTAPGAVTLELDGTARLFGAPEQAARRIAQHAASCGLQARVAVAADPDTALLMARGSPGVTFVPPGREAELLAPLPVELLEPSPEIAFKLALWGIRTLGELAALPETGLAERLGAEGIRLQALARGRSRRSLVPLARPGEFEERIELEHPVALLEPLLFLAAQLIRQVCDRLRERALAAIELELALELEGGGRHVRRHRLPVPMLSPRSFLKLLQLDLEAHPPLAPVSAIRLRAVPAAPRSLQHGLFVPREPEPEKLELMLTRLGALVGEGRAGAPEPLDTHRPDAFRVRRYVAPEACPLAGRKDVAVTLALRRFRPPRPARVEERDGRPYLVLAQGARGRVTGLSGPWRISGDWWTADAYAREEFDVALSDGGLYRIHKDLVRGGWFVAGSYD